MMLRREAREPDPPRLLGSGLPGPRDASPGATPFEDYGKAFVAGFLSTLVFHQGVLTLLWLSGAIPRTPYDMTPTRPLGLPAVVSLALWGGVWGAVIWPWVRKRTGRANWARALLIGALFPSAVALLVVFPLKGMPVAGAWDPRIIVGALVLNGAWGLGLAFFTGIAHRSTRHGAVPIESTK